MKKITILLAALMVCLSPVAVMALATPDVTPPVAPVTQVCPDGWLTGNAVVDLAKNGIIVIKDVVAAKDFVVPSNFSGGTLEEFVAKINTVSTVNLKVEDIVNWLILDDNSSSTEFAVPLNADGCLLDHFGIPMKQIAVDGIGASLK